MQVVLYLCVLALLAGFAQAFAPRHNVARPQKMQLAMGGKQSKFGIFSPAVIVVKTVLGEVKFNKLRGKAISLHSQAITEWCLQYGAYNLRLRLVRLLFLLQLYSRTRTNPSYLLHLPLTPPFSPILPQIKKAKKNGDELGFLI